jgi:hypothetical protein
MFLVFVLGVWRLTSYYGYPNGGRRIAAWNFFVNLLTNLSGHGEFLGISMTFWMLEKKEAAIIDRNG